MDGAVTMLVFEVLKELPVAVAIACRSIIEVRRVHEHVGAVRCASIPLELMGHPVGMRLEDPATHAAAIGERGCEALKCVSEFMREAPAIEIGDRARSYPHSRSAGVAATKEATFYDVDARLALVGAPTVRLGVENGAAEELRPDFVLQKLRRSLRLLHRDVSAVGPVESEMLRLVAQRIVLGAR